MTDVSGLDPSLLSTGLALPDGTTVTIRPRVAHPFGARLSQMASDVSHHVERHRPSLVVMEDLPLHAPGVGGLVRRAKLVGCFERDLRRMRIPVVFVNPSKLKKFATGNGNADKDAMVAAAVAAGADPRNDDEADAWHLRAIGVLQLDGTDLFHDPDALPSRQLLADDLDWSDLLEATHAYR